MHKTFNMLSESQIELQSFQSDVPIFSKAAEGYSKRTLVILGAVALAVGIGVGVAIGWFSHSDSRADCEVCPLGPCLGPDVPGKIIEDADEGITEQILDNMDADRIKDNL